MGNFGIEIDICEEFHFYNIKCGVLTNDSIWYLLVRLKAQAGSSNREKTQVFPSAGKEGFSAQHHKSGKHPTHRPQSTPKHIQRNHSKQKNKWDTIRRIHVSIAQSLQQHRPPIKTHAAWASKFTSNRSHHQINHLSLLEISNTT